MTEATVPPMKPGWDLGPVATFLSARAETDADGDWVDALPAISKKFAPKFWGADRTVNAYGANSHANLLNVECQQDFRTWLKANGVTAEQYAEAVGPIQYVSFQLHLLSIAERARSNKGWRVRVIGFPSLGVVACGLGTHYQGTQNHNQMGRAAHLIRTRALEVLSLESRLALGGWPSATADEWEERGLMPDPVLQIGGLDISGYDKGRGAKLRMVRNTTVKKELATFFAIKGMTLDDFRRDGPEYLETLREVALDLGRREP